METSSPTLADRLDAAIAALTDVSRGKSHWSDRIAYSVIGREFVHFHSPNEVDIRLTTRLQSQNREVLGADPRVAFRRNRSEWIAFSFHSSEDAEAALHWIRLARDANRH